MADNESDRRDFLKIGAAMGAGLTIGSPALAEAEQVGKKNSTIVENRNAKMIERIESSPVKYPFSFTITGDSGATTSPPNPLNDTIFSQLLTQMQQLNPKPLFFANLGDFAGPGSMARHRHYLDLADKLTIPNICVAGNHEHDEDENLKNYQRVHGPTNFTFAYGHTRFVALNTHRKAPRGPLSAELQYLDEVFSHDEHPNKIIFMHIPPDLDGHYAPHDDWSFSQGKQEFLSIIKKHNVRLVCCAHIIAYDYHVDDGISYVVSGSGGWGLCSHYGVCTNTGPPNRGAFYHFVELTIHQSGEITGRLVKAFDGPKYLKPYSFNIQAK